MSVGVGGSRGSVHPEQSVYVSPDMYSLSDYNMSGVYPPNHPPPYARPLIPTDSRGRSHPRLGPPLYSGAMSAPTRTASLPSPSSAAMYVPVAAYGVPGRTAPPSASIIFPPPREGKPPSVPPRAPVAMSEDMYPHYPLEHPSAALWLYARGVPVNPLRVPVPVPVEVPILPISSPTKFLNLLDSKRTGQKEQEKGKTDLRKKRDRGGLVGDEMDKKSAVRAEELCADERASSLSACTSGEGGSSEEPVYSDSDSQELDGVEGGGDGSCQLKRVKRDGNADGNSVHEPSCGLRAYGGGGVSENWSVEVPLNSDKYYEA